MIRGRVIDDRLGTLPYFPIRINDTIVVGKTDSDGAFQIDVPVSVKKLFLIDIGMEPASIELADTCDEVDVVMLLSSTYDFIRPKKVNRLRMKRFKKLPELHKAAFEKGLFKKDKGCHTQEFIPFTIRKRRLRT